MPAGRYRVMDGEGSPRGTEEFRCAPGPMGWRYFSDIRTEDPRPHDEVVDLSVDATWRPVRNRIATGSHEVLLTRTDDRLEGFRDGAPIAIPFGPERHLDYLSPCYNAVSATRLDAATEIDVCFLEPVTLEPRDERQRYEPRGEEEVGTEAGRFRAQRWRYTALSSGWTRDLWIAGNVVVRYDGLFELEWYDPGASGVTPLG